MGWETRNGNRYFYRKERIGDQVISSYIGPGYIGDLFARSQEVLEAKKQDKRLGLQLTRLKCDEILRLSEESERQVKSLVTALLLASGYHTHKRQWRKRRNGKTSS